MSLHVVRSSLLTGRSPVISRDLKSLMPLRANLDEGDRRHILGSLLEFGRTREAILKQDLNGCGKDTCTNEPETRATSDITLVISVATDLQSVAKNIRPPHELTCRIDSLPLLGKEEKETHATGRHICKQYEMLSRPSLG
jgi:hypothetical protein